MNSFGGMNVKKLWIIGALAMLLCGCGAQETFETIGQIEQPVQPKPWSAMYELPEDAGKPVIEGENEGALYMCKDYSISIQTLPGGDLNRTLQQCTGFSADNLQIMHTKAETADRYDTAWAASSENGDQVGRLTVLDDGHYHYVLAVMADAQKAGQLAEAWQTLFRSFYIADPEILMNTGS